MGEFILEKLMNARQFKLASTYLSCDGYKIIENPVNQILERSGSVRIVHGVDGFIPNPETISSLVQLTREHKSFDYQICIPSKSSFHPKIYMIEDANSARYTAVVGSSNLTHAGLFSNYEINCIVDGHLEDKPIQQCVHIFDALGDANELIRPSDEWISHYEQCFELRQGLNQAKDSSEQFDEALQHLIDLSPNDSELDWIPDGFKQLVIYILQNEFVGRDHDSGMQLQEIYKNARLLAKQLNHLELSKFKMENFENSIRGSLVNGLQRGYFERVSSGYWKLGTQGEGFKGTDRKNRIKS